MGIHSHSHSSIPIPYFYSHSHDVVAVTPIPIGIPWDPYGIPILPIPMHISINQCPAQ